jgi:aldose 1-epimerase
MRFQNRHVDLRVRLGLGGGIAHLRWRGMDILRPAPARPAYAGELGEFPMAPFVNRIASSRFELMGERIAIARAREADAHALHGHAWIKPWRRGANRVAYLQTQPNAFWPWAMEARRTFRIARDSVAIDFSLRNLGPGACPASIGFHPYFPRAGAQLHARVGAMVMTDKTGIPTRLKRTKEGVALSQGVAVEALTLDHCFTQWNGEARLTWPNRVVTMVATFGVAKAGRAKPVLKPMRFAQIYVPPGKDFFCFEPQTAMPDAVNWVDRDEAGVVGLDEGESLMSRLVLRFSPRPERMT